MLHLFHGISYFVYSLSFTIITILYFSLNSFFAIKSKKKIEKHSMYTLSDLTAVIPVYKENANLFERVIRALYDIGIEFVVVGDSSLEPYKSITERYGGKFIHLKEHKGKRYALAEGIKYVNSPLVMFLDSDTIVTKDALQKMIKRFTEDVGGVGPNIRIMSEGNKYAYYYSEFFERLSEIVNRAVSYFGSAIILSGQCAVYRTDLVKPYVTSSQFLEPKLLGKRIVISDDRDLTNYVIKSGYKAVRVFDAIVYTKCPSDIKVFTKQVIRWTRANYLNFIREIADGSIGKRGTLYVFDAIYTNLLPLFTILFVYMDFSKIMKLFSSTKIISSKIFLLLDIQARFHSQSYLLYLFIHYGSIVSIIPFVLTIIYLIPEDKMRTLIFGSIALAVQYVASLYAIITFWWQDWLTR
ncbi:glycosyltransferase family 2 protein [Sulfurisphaera javensis]|uniref:Glycosyltransferase family 2 protein n=1 Tax=Sulfurisphaera javensis TaxID=2049879 RepID=A0AAT9GP26_9CREN